MTRFTFIFSALVFSFAFSTNASALGGSYDFCPDGHDDRILRDEDQAGRYYESCQDKFFVENAPVYQTGPFFGASLTHVNQSISDSGFAHTTNQCAEGKTLGTGCILDGFIQHGKKYEDGTALTLTWSIENSRGVMVYTVIQNYPDQNDPSKILEKRYQTVLTHDHSNWGKYAKWANTAIERLIYLSDMEAKDIDRTSRDYYYFYFENRDEPAEAHVRDQIREHAKHWARQATSTKHLQAIKNHVVAPVLAVDG